MSNPTQWHLERFGHDELMATAPRRYSVATGHWVQRRFFPKLKSETNPLLNGVTFWVVMASLAYVWPMIVAGLLVTSRAWR